MNTTLILSAMGLLCGGVDTAQEVASLPVVSELPDPFLMKDGSRVATAADWAKRRKEIIDLLLHYEYGHMPPAPINLKVEGESSAPALDGTATLRRFVLTMGPENKVHMQMGLFVPTGKPGPFPVVLDIEPVWNDSLQPVARKVIERGYILAGFERTDLDADNADRSDGVHPLYPDYDWATLAVWAWGCMRAADYLLTLDTVDPKHMAVTGHSRGGKTALLAGALDERFALTVPHASGAGGAGSYRIQGDGAESLDAITDPKRFSYWFQPRLREFVGHEDRLPFDQHFLRALVAPRAVLSVEGLGDLWANPLGTQQIYRATQPVYGFLGAGDKNAILFRPGGHATTLEDWDALLEYADHVFFGKPTAKPFNELPFSDAPQPFAWKKPE